MPWIDIDEYVEDLLGNTNNGLLDIGNTNRDDVESGTLSPCAISSVPNKSSEYLQKDDFINNIFICDEKGKEHSGPFEMWKEKFDVDKLLKEYNEKLDNYKESLTTSKKGAKGDNIGLSEDVKNTITAKIDEEIKQSKKNLESQFNNAKDEDYDYCENHIDLKKYDHEDLKDKNNNDIIPYTEFNRYCINVVDGSYAHLVNLPTIGKLHPIESMAMCNALWNLSDKSSANDIVEHMGDAFNNIVLVDFFSRSGAKFKEIKPKDGVPDIPDTHTIVLWKYKQEKNNVNKIAIIDPNNKLFSDFIAENYPYWIIKNKHFKLIKMCEFNIKSPLIDRFYSNNAVRPPNPLVEIRLPRDCIDIAVKIAFEIYELQLFYQCIKHGNYDLAYKLDPYNAEINYNKAFNQLFQLTTEDYNENPVELNQDTFKQVIKHLMKALKNTLTKPQENPKEIVELFKNVLHTNKGIFSNNKVEQRIHDLYTKLSNYEHNNNGFKENNNEFNQIQNYSFEDKILFKLFKNLSNGVSDNKASILRSHRYAYSSSLENRSKFRDLYAELSQYI